MHTCTIYLYIYFHHFRLFSRSEKLNFNLKSTELKNSTLLNILQTPEVIETDAVDMRDIGITTQRNFNVLNNLTSLSTIHCMSSEGLNTGLENATIAEASDEKEVLQNNREFDFTKNDILDFSTNHVVC